MENNADSFDPAAIMEWMDALIALTKQRKELDTYNSQIATISAPNCIQIYSGIDILADTVGKELEEHDYKDGYHEYGFYYKDIKFFKVSKKRIGKYANGTD